MSAPILVTGGTGTLGRLLVRELLTGGHCVRVLSRKPQAGVPAGTPAGPGQPEWAVGDLHSGVGLAAALDGIGTVAHCATGTRGDAQMGAQLLIAAGRGSRPHIVFHSAVGAEAIRSGYYRDKRAMERLLEDGDVPWTVLRTTHLHEYFAAAMRRAARFPLMKVPGEVQFQPIAGAEVASRLLELCSGIQAHHVGVSGGPQLLTGRELAVGWLAQAHKRRKVLAIRVPGAEQAGWRLGAHLAPGRMVGEQTFAEYLLATREARAAEVAARRASKVAAKQEAKAAERSAREDERSSREEQKAAEKAARVAEQDKRAAERTTASTDAAPGTG